MNVPSVIYKGYTHSLQNRPSYTAGVSAAFREGDAAGPVQPQAEPERQHFSHKDFGQFDHLENRSDVLGPAGYDYKFVLVDFAQQMLVADKLRDAWAREARDRSGAGLSADQGRTYGSFSLSDDSFVYNSDRISITAGTAEYESHLGTAGAWDRYTDDRVTAFDTINLTELSDIFRSDSLKMSSEDFHVESDALFRPRAHQERRTTEEPPLTHRPPLQAGIEVGAEPVGLVRGIDTSWYISAYLIPGKLELDLTEPESGALIGYEVVMPQTGSGLRLDLIELAPEGLVTAPAARFGLMKDAGYFNQGVILPDQDIVAFSHRAGKPDRPRRRDEEEFFINRGVQALAVVNRSSWLMDRPDVPSGVVESHEYRLAVGRTFVGVDDRNTYVVELQPLPVRLEVQPTREHEVSEVPIGSTPYVWSFQREPAPIDFRAYATSLEGVLLESAFSARERTDSAAYFSTWYKDPSLFDGAWELAEARLTEPSPYDHIGPAFYVTLAERVRDEARAYRRTEWSDYEISGVQKQVQDEKTRKITENQLYGRDDPSIQEVIQTKERVDTFALVKAVQFEGDTKPGYQEPPLYSARADVTQYATKGLLIDAVTWGWGGREPVTP
ncbi:MAG: hypothetical protein AB1896_12400 [Thermodesulfobacteriota bacterium]